MRTLYPYGSKAILLLLTACLAFTATAQLNYSFVSINSTFVANTNATEIIGDNVNDQESTVRNIGFTFRYGCNNYTQFKASSNGFMSLGNSLNDDLATNDLTTTGQGPLLAPLWDDLATLNNTGSVNFRMTGVAPNRILTVEWLNMRWSRATTSNVISFQVKLYETTNVIEFVYRAGASNPNNPSASIGITGGSIAGDFYSVNATPTAAYGTASGITTRPATNAIYRFTPVADPYISSNVFQNNTTAISKCETAPQEEIIGVQVNVRSCASLPALTRLVFDMNNGAVADVNRIRIYYTGSTATFATTNEFGNGTITPATGNITVNGSQTLQNGDNYFWIAYELNAAAATTGNTLDARCSQLIVGGIARSPSVTNPAGSRTIAACATAPAGAKSSMAFWVKANAGTSSTTNGTAISAWSDQSGNARNASAAATATSPVYYNNSNNNINFNPVVGFDAAAQDAAQADFMDIPTGGILSSGSDPYTVYAVIKPGAGNLSTPGKFLFSGSTGTSNTFNSFDVRANYAFNDSWCLNDLIIENQWTANYPSLVAYDFNAAQRELFVAGSSSGTKASSARNSPNLNNALGCQRAVSPNTEFYDGGIAEIISYVNTSHNAAVRNKIESYLAIKYGITLSHNYLTSVGSTIWDRSLNPAYNANIIGIGRDDASALSQKQSKSTSVVPDILTLYIGSTKQVNQASNTGAFSGGDRSFFMVANNNDQLLPTSLPTEVPSGICCRLSREWLVQKANFINTDLKLEFDFNIITPGYMPLNVADLRLLVDNDGNFTNATTLGPSGTTSFSVNAGVVTVTISAASIANGSYFTLASVSTNTPLPVRFVKLSAGCANSKAQVNWTAENETNNVRYIVERSADGRNFTAVTDVNTQTGAAIQQQYRWVDAAPLPGTSYYRVKTTDKSNATGYSPIMTFVDCGTEAVKVINNGWVGEKELFLQLSANAKVEIAVLDALGRNYAVAGLTGIQNRTAGTYHLPVTRQLAKGLYLLSVTINGNKKVFRITQ